MVGGGITDAILSFSAQIANLPEPFVGEVKKL